MTRAKKQSLTSGVVGGGAGDELLDYKEAAALLRMSKDTLYRLVGANEIPYVRLSARRVRFWRSEINAWIKQASAEVATNG